MFIGVIRNDGRGWFHHIEIYWTVVSNLYLILIFIYMYMQMNLTVKTLWFLMLDCPGRVRLTCIQVLSATIWIRSTDGNLCEAQAQIGPVNLWSTPFIGRSCWAIPCHLIWCGLLIIDMILHVPGMLMFPYFAVDMIHCRFLQISYIVIYLWLQYITVYFLVFQKWMKLPSTSCLALRAPRHVPWCGPRVDLERTLMNITYRTIPRTTHVWSLWELWTWYVWHFLELC